MEILTQANAILGQGQMSLAKYLFIVAHEDAPSLRTHDVMDFLAHVLERLDTTSDLHFQTNTTIDTLDYSGDGLNRGSKVVIAAAGAKRRDLSREIPAGLVLAPGFTNPRVCGRGVLAIETPSHNADPSALQRFCDSQKASGPLSGFPLIVLVDDSDFCARSESNFLWSTFTRSNPANDIDGIESFTQNKAWGCRGSIVIDARIKGFHAPPLLQDPILTQRVDRWIKGHPALKRWALVGLSEAVKIPWVSWVVFDHSPIVNSASGERFTSTTKGNEWRVS
jgi:4-hydroxy-3-polyprenylbenzoate decarboxylase